jgi:3-hydroxyacyl-[acyl-carrier-protein] dehydratase
MRWIWVDRILEFRPREFARAVKLWSFAEEIFAAHFPEFPVIPASLLLEGLAQTGGILVGDANDYREKVILAKFPKARFFFDVFAGQELIYDVTLVQLREEGAVVDGKITVEGATVAEAEIYFAHLDQSRSQQVFGDRNFVFSGELKNLLGLVKRPSHPPASPAP